jgi:hypothetical protein
VVLKDSTHIRLLQRRRKKQARLRIIECWLSFPGNCMVVFMTGQIKLMLDVSRIRSDFPVLDRRNLLPLVYLDSAATSRNPDVIRRWTISIAG